MRENCGDAARVSSTQAVDCGAAWRQVAECVARRRFRFILQRADRDLEKRRSGFAGEEHGNRWLPHVRLEPRLLLGGDALLLEFSGRPPGEAAAKERYCFGKQLIAITAQVVDVDGPGLDRPEPPVAGFVAQVER